MTGKGLVLDNDGNVQQCFAIIEGQTNKTDAAVIVRPKLVHCAVSGTLAVKYNSGTTENIPMESGERFSFSQVDRVTVTSGTYHFG